MTRGLAIGLALAGWILWGAARADEFDKIEGTLLANVPKSADARERKKLTFAELEGLPIVLHDSRSALLVVVTDRGNLARLLVVPGFHTLPEEKREPVPVVVLERFDTFEVGNLATRLARGKDLILFAGFQLDLDTGQVVPEGRGGDLRFVSAGEGGPRLETLGQAKIYTFTRPIMTAGSDASRPSLGRAVLPGDFAGRYRLYANGQWSGTLDLKIGTDRTVTGRFRSDLNGTSYPVAGQVAADVPQKITFTIKYPRTEQELEGLLWTEGKGAMAGTLTMIGRSYGFFAVREGARFAPEGEDVGPVARGQSRPHRKFVTVRKGQYTLDGQPKTDQELTDALKKAVAAEPATWVLLQVPEDEPYAAVRQAFEVISAGGVSSIRVGAGQ